MSQWLYVYRQEKGLGLVENYVMADENVILEVHDKPSSPLARVDRSRLRRTGKGARPRYGRSICESRQ